MTELGHLAGVLPRSDESDVGQVGAGGQDVLLAGHGDRVDLTGGRTVLQFVEALVQLDERSGTERVGTVVVTPVVERDEGKSPARGQANVAHARVRDDLVVGERQQGREVDLIVGAHEAAHFLRFLPS